MTDYELRVIKGCPNTVPALNLFRIALEAAGLPVTRLRVRVLTSDREAQELGFQGSPSFIAAGDDLFPAVAIPAVSCRVYPSAGKMAGLPALASLVAAVRGSGQEA
ncbi:MULTISPECIES: hypothetical protein [Paenarthrobacter]|uniref:Alkylmercury lyase n=1 Tax=Paenarthrobacter ureafaciens TaxID=37931 RepID=A0AAX3ELR2_PAEUR|nr:MULTISPECIES: hypothetical protein [Paenarthrobacter]NKR13899.1 hypothetical protein [Arthrobacter sp. M5]NKR17337.1 hypothetical protein [Arthrobacter sp. M6]OEH58641.1 hypothetical protein A5N17_21135 [Arthrobacter sp. D2]OEH61519.1 hypothetical protein A5N13_16540 [Arthrobacter sp. D4]MDO5862986.1 hypothetical protein [Paenarthrobacter sp. SD-2]